MSRTHGSKDFWLTALRGDGVALRTAIAEPGALSRPVPSAPEWTVGELVRHLGAQYEWVRGHAGRGVTERPPEMSVPATAPAGGDATLLPWFDDQLARLDAFLDALDPERAAWNWAPQAKTAAFWHRRMAHETAIHRWDAQTAVGLPEPIEAKLAGDTIAEVLDTFLPAGRRKRDGEHSGMIQLAATDLGQEWYVRLRGPGIALLDTDTLLDDDAHPARAAAAGSASDVALALWGRVNFDVLDVAGDEDLLDALRVG